MPFPVLPKTPVPHLSLSAAGLVALADLQTIARRAALTGTSSWLDALVLAPGLHYQQAAEEVISGTDSDAGSAVTARALGSGNDGSGGGVFAAEALADGTNRPVRVTNPGMLLLLSRVRLQEDRRTKRERKQTTLRKRHTGGGGVEAFAAGGDDKIHDDEHRVVFLDVGTLNSGKRKRAGRAFTSADAAGGGGDWEFERASNVLYLASPLLTAGAVTMMVLLGDWWGLSAITALMTSRILNIYILKARTPPPSPHPPPSSALSEYKIPLTPSLTVHLRGPSHDLDALTSRTTLLPRTEAQNYLEAAAKLAVYVVAALGGNVSQSGNAVLLVLLLGSAALLGLSNGSMKGVRGQGRVARVWDGSSTVRKA